MGRLLVCDSNGTVTNYFFQFTKHNAMALILIVLGTFFVFFVVLFVRTSCKYIKENELNLLANASVLFLATIISGAMFFVTLSDWIDAPVVSPCKRIVYENPADWEWGCYPPY